MSYNSSFASVYDRFTEDVEYKARAEYIMRLLKTAGANKGILLDLACGTGSLSQYFLSAGYDIIAIDNSPDMLSEARKKLGNDALLLCQDMRSIDLYGTVDAIVCSLDSINHLTETDYVQSCFNSVSLFTAPGGIFIFDVNTLYKHREILSGNTFVYESDDAMLVWQNSECSKNGTVDISIDIFVEQDYPDYSRYSEDFGERAYSAAELTAMAQNAGFEVLRILGDMKETTPSEKEERIYFVCRKG